jgi:hypothetical protein
MNMSMLHVQVHAAHFCFTSVRTVVSFPVYSFVSHSFCYIHSYRIRFASIRVLSYSFLIPNMYDSLFHLNYSLLNLLCSLQSDLREHPNPLEDRTGAAHVHCTVAL